VEILRRWRPDFLQGYAGALSHVSEAMSGQARRDIRSRFMWCGAEVLTRPMRDRISKAFATPVYEIYGSHELHLIAWECRETGEFHTCDDNVIVEVLKDGRTAAPGEQGEMVGTVLHSFAMPFIRYRLGDIVTKGTDTCGCGAPFSTLRNVQGRTIDYFPLPDGRMLHPYHIVHIVLDSAPWVRRYRLVQERLDLVTLRVIPFGEPTREQVRRLERAVAPVLGPLVEFHVIQVPEIQVGPGGKFRVSCSLVTAGRDGLGWEEPLANRALTQDTRESDSG